MRTWGPPCWPQAYRRCAAVLGVGVEAQDVVVGLATDEQPRLAIAHSHHCGPHDVVIVGGGDSAFDWAWSLRDIAKSVCIVHRRGEFRAHAATVDKVRDAGIRLITNAEVAEVRGGAHVTDVVVKSKLDESLETLPCQTLVAALGFVANIGPITEWGLDTDKRHIKVDSAMFTNLPRVLAAGDICSYEGRVPLIAVGFGEAATAVNNAAPLINPDAHVFPGHSSGGSAD